MSSSVTYDIMTLLEEMGFGTIGKGIYDPLLLETRSPAHGILVEQRNTSPVPDVINGDDTLYVNIQVRGAGTGEVGRNRAHQRAMEVYRALSIVLDRTVNGTFYEIITPDSAPYEICEGEHCDVLFGLEVVRYFKEDY